MRLREDNVYYNIQKEPEQKPSDPVTQFVSQVRNRQTGQQKGIITLLPQEPKQNEPQSSTIQPESRGQLLMNNMVAKIQTRLSFERTQSQMVSRRENIQWFGLYNVPGQESPVAGWDVRNLMVNVSKQNTVAYQGYNKSNQDFTKSIVRTPKGSMFYKTEEQYIVATPEMQGLLAKYKNKGYTPPGGDIGFYQSPPRPSDVLSNIKGTATSKIIIGSEAYMNLGLSFAFAGIQQGLTGDQAIERQYQEYAYRGIQSLPGRNENTGGALSRQLTSPEVIFDVYVPLATMGLGYAFKPVLSPIVSRVGSKLAGISTAKMIGGNYVKFNALQIVKGVGIGAAVSIPAYSVASTAIYNPGGLPSVAGRLTSNLVMMGAGWKLGESLYETKSVNALWESYATRRVQTPDTQLGAIPGGVLQGRIVTSETLILRKPTSVIEEGVVLRTGAFVSRIGTNIESTGFMHQMKITESPRFFEEGNIIKGKPVTYDLNIISGGTDVPLSTYTRGLKELRGKNVFDFSPDGSINMRYAEGGYGPITTSTKNIPFSGMSVGKTLEIKGTDFMVSKYSGFSPEVSNMYTGYSIGKSFYGGETGLSKGKIHFIETKPEIDYDFVLSRTKYSENIFSNDIAKITTPRMIKAKEYYGSSGGMDTTGITEINKGIQDSIHLPGSSGQFSLQSSGMKGYQGSFSKMMYPGKTMSLSQIESLEYGLQGSTYWTGTKPRMINVQSSALVSGSVLGSISSSRLGELSVTDVKTISINRSLNMSGFKSINETKVASLTKTSQITDVLSIQSTRQEQVSINAQALIFSPITIPGIMTTPVSPITRITPGIPFLPEFYLPYSVGGGFGPRRRKRKGSRTRTHGVRLLDSIYDVRISI